MSWLTDLPTAIRAIPRLEKLMGAVADALAGVSEQLGKAQGEILGKISELETRLADAGKLDPADEAALQAVKDAAQRLDDIVPDPAAEEPNPTPAEQGEPTPPTPDETATPPADFPPSEPA